MEFYNYIESLKKVFDNINEITDNLDSSFQSESANELKKKNENIRLSFYLVQDKLKKYADELSNVKMKFQDFSSDLSSDIAKSGEKLQSDYNNTK